MKELVLRPHQMHVEGQLREQLRSGASWIVLVAPTAFGKTETAIHLIRLSMQKGKRVWFLVDRVTLARQTSDRFHEYGIDHGVVQGANAENDRYAPEKNVQIMTIQTFERREFGEEPDLIFYDECHSQYQKTLERLKQYTRTKIIGLTATPFTAGMADYWGGLVNGATVNRLLKDGFLAPLKIKACVSPDMTGATTPIDMGIAGRKFQLQRRAAGEAEGRKGMFEALSQGAQSSSLRNRMPDKFREFVERATEGSPVENVFVPAEQFSEYFQSIGVDPYALVDDLDGVTRDDLDIALAGGGDLRIPTATYAAKMAGTEHDAFLMEHMRFDPDEMTARQAAEFNEKVAEIRQEAWELSEQLRQQEEQFRTFEQEIYDTMVSRLREAGRSTEVATTEAMLYPAFYRVMAERSGMAVDEFMARYPLPQVRGERPEGMQFKDVDALTRTLAEARARRDAGLDRRGMSLLEFIDDHGGINDPGGELRARDAEVIKRGRGKKTLRLSRGRMAAVRDMFGGSGKKFGLDDVAQAAIEAGYMADDPTVVEYQNAVREGREVPNIGNALLEAIDRELRGEPQFSSTAPVDQAAVDTDAALEGIDAYLSQLGVGLDDDDATIRAAVEADQEEGRQYSQAAKDAHIWRSKLVDLMRGKLRGEADLRVGRTPLVLRALGVPEGQVVFRASKIRRVMREHGDIGAGSLIDLPAMISDPAIVYEEVGKESDFVLVSDKRSSSGAPVVVAIKAEGESQGRAATVVLTVYPLDDAKARLAAVHRAGRVRYVRDGAAGAESELTSRANSGSRDAGASSRSAAARKKILSAEDVFKGKGYKQPGDERGARGSIQFPRDGVGNGDSIIRLFQTADLSTMLHESGHYFLTVMQDLAARGEEGAAADVVAVKDWWRKNAAEVARETSSTAQPCALHGGKEGGRESSDGGTLCRRAVQEGET